MGGGEAANASHWTTGRTSEGGSAAEGVEALINPLLLAAPPSPPLLGELFFSLSSFLFPSAETGCHDDIEHSFHGERLSRLTASVTGDGTGNHLDLLSHLLEEQTAEAVYGSAMM